MDITTVLAAEIDLPLARKIAELLCTVWPKLGRTVETRIEQMQQERTAYHGRPEQAPRSYVILDDDKLLAHAAIATRTITTANGEITVAGLAKVCTDPEQRGQGLGEQIVRAAFAPVDDGTFEVSLFQTTEDVRPFYEKMGARAIENKIVNSMADDPQANPFWDPDVMIYPGNAKPGGNDWPTGEIDLKGPGY